MMKSPGMATSSHQPLSQPKANRPKQHSTATSPNPQPTTHSFPTASPPQTLPLLSTSAPSSLRSSTHGHPPRPRSDFFANGSRNPSLYRSSLMSCPCVFRKMETVEFPEVVSTSRAGRRGGGVEYCAVGVDELVKIGGVWCRGEGEVLMGVVRCLGSKKKDVSRKIRSMVWCPVLPFQSRTGPRHHLAASKQWYRGNTFERHDEKTRRKSGKMDGRGESRSVPTRRCR